MARRMASLLLRLGGDVGEGFVTQKVPGSTDATARAARACACSGASFISVRAGTASKNAESRMGTGKAAELARDGMGPGPARKTGLGSDVDATGARPAPRARTG